ncbi:MAG: hypothetical protein EKK53_00765 [Burkholderiales bacterium]|nr:MAG: hypothetical protein EKK53_00765 [Burkholderiales bacterium]
MKLHHLRNEIRLSMSNWRQSAVCFCALLPLLLLVGFGDWVFAFVMAAAVTALLHMGLHRYLQELTRRAQAKNSLTWDVHVGDVAVGSISDADLAQIQHTVYSEYRTFIVQALNCAGAAKRALLQGLASLPGAAFYLLIGWAIIDAASLSAGLVWLRDAATPEDLRGLAIATLKLGGTLIALASLTMLAISSYGYGMTNKFTEAIGVGVRQLLKVPAAGEVVLSRLVDGKRVYPYSRKHALDEPPADAALNQGAGHDR